MERGLLQIEVIRDSSDIAPLELQDLLRQEIEPRPHRAGVEVRHKVDIKVQHLVREVVLDRVWDWAEEERQLGPMEHSIRGVVTRDELGEEVPIQRLQRRCLVEQQPPRGEVHVVRVPRLGAVKQGVARVERATEGRVVRGVERYEFVECRGCYRRRVDEERLDERLESSVLLGWRGVQVAHRLAECGAFVKVSAREDGHVEELSARDLLGWPSGDKASWWTNCGLPQLTIHSLIRQLVASVRQVLERHLLQTCERSGALRAACHLQKIGVREPGTIVHRRRRRSLEWSGRRIEDGCPEQGLRGREQDVRFRSSCTRGLSPDRDLCRIAAE